MINVYYRLEEFTKLEGLIEKIQEKDPLLNHLANKLQSVGLCESAVNAYVKFGDIKRAIDACVILHQWNQAVELAEEHKFVQIEGLLQKKFAAHLIDKNKKMEAIELYRKANRNTESAKLLAEIAADLQMQKAPPLMIKKIYVLAAFEVDSYK